MAFETTLTVPTPHVRELMARLARAGFLVLDTGERMTTDDGFEAEATLRLAHVTPLDVDPDAPVALGVSA
jgi:hypothetical protein